MQKKLLKLIDGFATIPFLFIGSGLTRRYYNLPDWRGLLEVFAKRIHSDEFFFSSIEDRAKRESSEVGLYPKIADLLEKEFNDKWYKEPAFRNLDKYYLDLIKVDGVSPFKAEIAMYINNNSIINPLYQEEIAKFKELTSKSISGIITTNYDCFLEENTEGFKTFVGQEELVFSAIQGIAEIYKIHGSITQPQSVILNEEDYKSFFDQSAYLAAKLMTIFMEYPIVFLGYSISDNNIQNILRSIVKCLSNEKIMQLENRFVFIEYSQLDTDHDADITSYSINFDGKILTMTKVSLSDFGMLYDVLQTKKSALPVRLLRMFKQEYYDFTVTNKPTAKIKVGAIDNPKIKDDDYVLAIGIRSELGLVGLTGLKGSDWFTNYLFNNLDFTADELLERAFPVLIKQNNKLPVHKYLSEATGNFPECAKYAEQNETFDAIINNSIKNQRNSIQIPIRTVKAIWDNKEDSIERRTRLIAHLNEDEIDKMELKEVIYDIFTNNPNILETKNANEKTNIRRLVRIFDYLAYGK